MAPFGLPEIIRTHGKIWRITTSGTITEFDVSGRPNWIVVGSDGALWFSEYNLVGRITTAGEVTEYPVPANPRNVSSNGIAAGPDGALWFTEGADNKIGRITTGGTVTEFVVPTPNSEPFLITPGPDGAVWFTEYKTHQIARITATGVITEYRAETNHPQGITAGPDGALWFTSGSPRFIGRAPACALGFTASLSGATLKMSFDLGIDTPANFNILLLDATGGLIGEPFSRTISPVVPPAAFSLTWSNLQNRGT